MNKKQNPLFSKVLFKGIFGAFTGIIAGFILGFIIWTLQDIVSIIRNWGISEGVLNYTQSSPPLEALLTLGMAFGAIIGSIFGSLTGLKEGKNKN